MGFKARIIVSFHIIKYSKLWLTDQGMSSLFIYQSTNIRRNAEQRLTKDVIKVANQLYFADLGEGGVQSLAVTESENLPQSYMVYIRGLKWVMLRLFQEFYVIQYTILKTTLVLRINRVWKVQCITKIIRVKNTKIWSSDLLNYTMIYLHYSIAIMEMKNLLNFEFVNTQYFNLLKKLKPWLMTFKFEIMSYGFSWHFYFANWRTNSELED